MVVFRGLLHPRERVNLIKSKNESDITRENLIFLGEIQTQSGQTIVFQLFSNSFPIGKDKKYWKTIGKQLENYREVTLFLLAQARPIRVRKTSTRHSNSML